VPLPTTKRSYTNKIISNERERERERTSPIINFYSIKKRDHGGGRRVLNYYYVIMKRMNFSE
jgi:hypothetical protein